MELALLSSYLMGNLLKSLYIIKFMKILLEGNRYQDNINAATLA